MASRIRTIWAPIIRTAHAAGAAAVLIPERRAAGLTETVARSAAGALAYLPVVRIVNVSRALEELKKRGYWIYGLDERGEQLYDQVEFTKPTAIVLGGEGKGLHEQVREALRFSGAHPDGGRRGISKRQRGGGRDAVRVAPAHYRPVKFGSRFSRNASTPSR